MTISELLNETTRRKIKLNLLDCYMINLKKETEFKSKT